MIRRVLLSILAVLAVLLAMELIIKLAEWLAVNLLSGGV